MQPGGATDSPVVDQQRVWTEYGMKRGMVGHEHCGSARVGTMSMCSEALSYNPPNTCSSIGCRGARGTGTTAQESCTVLSVLTLTAVRDSFPQDPECSHDGFRRLILPKCHLVDVSISPLMS